MNGIPNIGDIVLYNGNRYRVTGYRKPLNRGPQKLHDGNWIDTIIENILAEEADTFVPWFKDGATHITGKGICGCVAPIHQLTIVGRVDWTEDRIQECVDSSNRRANESLKRYYGDNVQKVDFGGKESNP